jgi:hypothetical protein
LLWHWMWQVTSQYSPTATFGCLAMTHCSVECCWIGNNGALIGENLLHKVDCYEQFHSQGKSLLLKHQPQIKLKLSLPSTLTLPISSGEPKHYEAVKLKMWHYTNWQKSACSLFVAIFLLNHAALPNSIAPFPLLLDPCITPLPLLLTLTGFCLIFTEQWRESIPILRQQCSVAELQKLTRVLMLPSVQQL